MFNDHKCNWQCFDILFNIMDKKIEKYGVSVRGLRMEILLNHIKRGVVMKRNDSMFKELVSTKEVYSKNYGFTNMGRG